MKYEKRAARSKGLLLEESMNLKPLEVYLDECEAPLARLPETERAGWRDEAQQHLVALVEAHIELGASEEEAVEAALRQFGEPNRLGKKLAVAMRRTACPRAEAHRRGVAGWTITWNLVFAMLVSSRLLLTPPEGGSGAWGSAVAAWSLGGVLAIFLAGHLLAKVMLRQEAGDRRVWSFLGMSYVGFTVAGLLATGTLPLMTPTQWLATACSLAVTLGAGWLAARMAARRRDQACGVA